MATICLIPKSVSGGTAAVVSRVIVFNYVLFRY